MSQSMQSTNLSESEMILQTLVSNIPVITFLFDSAGIIKRIQGGSLEAFGPKPAELVGRSVFSVYRNSPEIMDDCRRALAGEKFMSNIELIGYVFNVWFTPLFNPDGSISGVIGIASDITERTRAEDLLQQQASLLYSVSDALVATNADLVIESWNYAAERMYGWREDEVFGQSLSDFLNVTQPADSEQDVIAMTFEHGLWSGELLQQGRDGQPINVLASFSRVDRADGSPFTIIAVFHDITERKRAEERAMQLTIEKEKIRMLKEFIADASHDLRTPITTIQTSAYLLRKKNPTLDSVNLDTIEMQATHLGRLVDDLVTLSRLDASTRLYQSPLELNLFVGKICDSFQATAIKQQQKLEFEADPQVDSIVADEIELQRAITNLIGNALNYTPEGGVIKVVTTRQENQVMIEVADSGIGISEDDQSRIFDRFYRVNKTRPTDKGGTGLGLAITKKIVEAHGGQISVASVMDQGSTFTIPAPDRSTAVTPRF